MRIGNKNVTVVLGTKCHHLELFHISDLAQFQQSDKLVTRGQLSKHGI